MFALLVYWSPGRKFLLLVQQLNRFCWLSHAFGKSAHKLNKWKGSSLASSWNSKPFVVRSILLHVNWQLDEPQNILQLNEPNKLKGCLEDQRKVAGMKMEDCRVKMEFSGFCFFVLFWFDFFLGGGGPYTSARKMGGSEG